MIATTALRWLRSSLVAAALALSACQTIPYERPGVLPPAVQVADGSAERAALNARVYDQAVRYVERLFYSRDFQGTDFAAEAASRRAEAVAQTTELDFYARLEQLVEVLGDDHTQALSPTRRERLAANDAGAQRPAYGVVILPRGDERWVLRVRPDSPAAEAGVMPGWKIESINGASPHLGSVAREDRADRFVFLDEVGERHQIELTGVLMAPLPRMEARRLEGDIAYIRFDDFDRETFDWYKGEFDALAQAPPAGLIVDLRSNGGGSLNLTGLMLSYLFDRRIDFAVTQGRFINRIYNVEPPERPYLGPVVILVGSASASGGELYPAVARELDRAVIVGEPTRGAVIASRLVELPDGGGIRIGMTDMTTPAGVRLEKTGVTPDIVLDTDWSEIRAGRDPGLTIALAQIERLRAEAAERPATPPPA
ncbi:S41 family peptidase [Brevundimonas sp. TWP2-3-2]|uniref:S41 family peptidase n=1 Tax=Brevundimonas sp. TWP2-3-2 TaxID=2804648 RepID=UPI003CEECEDB